MRKENHLLAIKAIYWELLSQITLTQLVIIAYGQTPATQQYCFRKDSPASEILPTLVKA